MQIDVSGDISQMSPNEREVALTIRQAQLIIDVRHFSLACAESVGQPMGVVKPAEADWIARSSTEAVIALGYGLRDRRRGLADATDLWDLQQRVVHLGMALYAVVQ